MKEPNKISKYLDVLQVFRGLAAILVIFHHTAGSIKYYHNVDYYWLDLLQSIGKYGVDFFFILSGFIISYTAYFKRNNEKAFSLYLKNRLLRIYTPYLPIGISMFLLYTYFPSLSNSSRDVSALTSFTLFPYGNPALSVAWTLSHEVIFYILFSIYFISKKSFRILFSLWVCLIIYFNWFSSFNLSVIPIAKYLLSAYNLEFVLGIILSNLLFLRFRFNVYLVSILSFLLWGLFFSSIVFEFGAVIYFYSNILFSLFSFLLIYISVAYKNISINKNNIWMLVGNATFLIYLLHNTLQMIIVRFFSKIQIDVRVVLMLVSCLLVSCFLGYIYYMVFEIRLTNFFRKRIKK